MMTEGDAGTQCTILSPACAAGCGVQCKVYNWYVLAGNDTQCQAVTRKLDSD